MSFCIIVKLDIPAKHSVYFFVFFSELCFTVYCMDFKNSRATFSRATVVYHCDVNAVMDTK